MHYYIALLYVPLEEYDTIDSRYVPTLLMSLQVFLNSEKPIFFCYYIYRVTSQKLVFFCVPLEEYDTIEIVGTLLMSLQVLNSEKPIFFCCYI